MNEMAHLWMSTRSYSVLMMYYSRLIIKIKDGKSHLISVAYRDFPPNGNGAAIDVEGPDRIRVTKAPVAAHG